MMKAKFLDLNLHFSKSNFLAILSRIDTTSLHNNQTPEVKNQHTQWFLKPQAGEWCCSLAKLKNFLHNSNSPSSRSTGSAKHSSNKRQTRESRVEGLKGLGVSEAPNEGFDKQGRCAVFEIKPPSPKGKPRDKAAKKPPQSCQLHASG